MQLKVDVSTAPRLGAELGLGIGLDISCLSFLDLERGHPRRRAKLLLSWFFLKAFSGGPDALSELPTTSERRECHRGASDGPTTKVSIN